MSDHWEVECDCGKTLAVPFSKAGKRIKCPVCERRITMPDTPGEEYEEEVDSVWEQDRQPDPVQGEPEGSLPFLTSEPEVDYGAKQVYQDSSVEMPDWMFYLFRKLAVGWTILCLLVWLAIVLVAMVKLNSGVADYILGVKSIDAGLGRMMIAAAAYFIVFIASILVVIGIWLEPAIAILVGLSIFKLIKHDQPTRR